MAFERPISVADAVKAINEQRYVLPAIQREFVWRPDQIIRLFDSLLKGYPIGSFLFWTIGQEQSTQYSFYNFVRDYHERDATHNPKAHITAKGNVTAVLDGQQRLTALYIGLSGTHASRKAKAWRNNPNAYPKRRLYLCLTSLSEDPEFTYQMEFREDKSDIVREEGGGVWFRIGAVMGYTSLADVFKVLAAEKLGNNSLAIESLNALWEAVTVKQTISAYLVQSPDLDRVLNIFVRVNSGGTVLSYSDLLLSIATAEWKTTDAREEIHDLVDQINKIGLGFEFSKDFVLKTCLMVADLETRFSTANFSSKNMGVIEKRWDEIKQAIVMTVELLQSFGLSSATLASANAVVPITYYLTQRGLPKGFVSAKAHGQDRERIRRWLLRALLKRTLTGQPDSILRVVRDTIKAKGKLRFPEEEIITALSGESRTMTVTDADLDGMLEETYQSGYAFSTLALLYPTLDFRNQFHLDHIHPRSTVIHKRLTTAGITDVKAREECIDRRDDIVNLQFLSGTQNLEKSATPFAEWFKAGPGKNAKAAAEYRRLHFLPGDVDYSLGSFIEFTDARRALMKQALRDALGMQEGP